MNLLVLGGTVFLGRHVVEAALRRGHRPVLFNRGRHGAGLFAGVEALRGDRDGDLEALRGRRFDAVIDTSGYTPAQVRASAAMLGDAVEHYVFVSSISVYRTFPPGCAFDEDAPLLEGDEGYGAAKARAEEVLAAQLPGRVARVRPGLIVGPHDPTGRFTYWPVRAAQGGAIVAPGRPGRPVQFIDARDLAEWIVDLAERRRAGVFNATGPAATLTLEALLDACLAAGGAPAVLRWVDDAALLAFGVEPWTELPLWLPEDDPSFGGMLQADVRRAVAAGLVFRPLHRTVADTLAWARHAAPGAPGAAPATVHTLSAERERALLGMVRG